MSNSYILTTKEKTNVANPNTDKVKQELVAISKKVGLSILSGCLNVIASNLVGAAREINNITEDKNI